MLFITLAFTVRHPHRDMRVRCVYASACHLISVCMTATLCTPSYVIQVIASVLV